MGQRPPRPYGETVEEGALSVWPHRDDKEAVGPIVQKFAQNLPQLVEGRIHVEQGRGLTTSACSAAREATNAQHGGIPAVRVHGPLVLYFGPVLVGKHVTSQPPPAQLRLHQQQVNNPLV